MTERMIEVLKLLACSADQQQAVLPDFVVVADEVALLFDDELRLVEIASCTPVIRDGLRFIDTRLSNTSGDRSLWSLDALQASPDWERVRSAARALLSALGVSLGLPVELRPSMGSSIGPAFAQLDLV